MTDLIQLMNENDIKICLLSETWWNDNFNTPPPHEGYRLIRKDRDYSSRHHKGGGVAILIHNSIETKTLNITTPFESVWTTIYLQDKTELNIGSCYLAPDTTARQYPPLKDIFTSLPPNTIIGGDFNAKHPMWSDTNQRINKAGRITFEILQESDNIALLNTGTDTHFPTFKQNDRPKLASAIDLTFATTDISPNLLWTTLSQLNGQHVPVLIEHSNAPLTFDTDNFTPRWKFSDNDIQPYTESAENSFSDLLPLLSNDPSAAASQIYDTVHTVAEATCRKTKPHHKPPNPFWSAKLNNLRKRRQRLREKSNSQRTCLAQKRYNNACNQYFAELDKSKHETVLEKSKSVTSNKSIPQIWSSLNQVIDRKPSHTIQPLINPDNSISLEPTAKSHTLLHNYRNTSSDRDKSVSKETPEILFDDDFRESIETSLVQNQEDFKPTKFLELDENKPFTLSELKVVLDSLKDSSPGPDNINNWFLRNAPHSMRLALLHLANLSLTTGTLPQQYKFADIIPIPKPGKPRNQPSSYRPISLINTISRVIEKLIYERLYYLADTRHWFPPTQFAYRKHHSTLDALICLTTDILGGLNHNHSTFFIQIDFSKAFDKVWPKGLLYKLHQLGLRGPILALIADFLTDRKYRVMLPTPSTYTTFDIGTPQGSCLSALLFVLYTADLLKTLSVNHSGYADDTGLWHTSQDFTQSINLLNKSLETVSNWCIRWRLKLNADKTTYTAFLPRGLVFNPDNHPTLTMLGIPLKRVRNPKFLGLILDPNLTWKPHFDYLLPKAERRVNALKRLLATPWKHNREALLTIYKGFVRSALEYGSCIWFTAAQSHLDKLDRLQNRCLRMIAGAMKTTPEILLSTDLKCSQLHFRRQIEVLSQLHRIQAFGEQSQLFRRLNLFCTMSDSRTHHRDPSPHPHFFSRAFKFHHELLNSPPLSTQPKPLPALFAPWHQQPHKVRHSEHSTFKHNVRLLVRKNQNSAFQKSPLATYFRNHCPDSALIWDSDLKHFYQSRILFRLRTGHSRLAAHNRISNDNFCPCGSPQTASHLLFSCQLLSNSRKHLLTELATLTEHRSQQNLSFLLNPPQTFQKEVRLQILSLVVTFFQSSGVKV